MSTSTSTQADLSDAARAILKALAELSAAQGALDLDPERDHAPRDYAMQKAVAAFRQFAVTLVETAARQPQKVL